MDLICPWLEGNTCEDNAGCELVAGHDLSVRKHHPKSASGILREGEAIDVWMLSCMTFVFCSLLELAWVGYLSREEEYSPPPSAVALPTKTLPIPPLTSNKTTPVAPPTPSH
ncbi:hypothetical protein ANCCEY_15302, partial [Ancylostoma ceylanicum]